MNINKDDIYSKAAAFLKTCYQELEREDQLQKRLEEVKSEILESGTYYHTSEELTHGARMAWRNSNRCIGRLYWKTLKVIDARQLDQEEDIFKALEHHINYAFNKGEIRSTITIFRQQMPDEFEGPRILNHQLLHFAGHLHPDDSVVGDPSELALTQWCASMGHRFDNTAFDMLPHVIQWPGREKKMKMFTLPEGIVFPIIHPEYDWFVSLKLFWYAVPIISEMMLEIGGVRYTAAPFNGWYMVTEIGSRNFGDTKRYDMLPAVAHNMGLNLNDEFSFWKDKALIELNRAVLYSFQQRGVTMSSHYESSEQFILFEASEQRRGRNITADWSWITPPISGSALEVFHRHYDNTVLTPNFFYQDPLIGKPKQDIPKGCPFHSQSLNSNK